MIGNSKFWTELKTIIGYSAVLFNNFEVRIEIINNYLSSRENGTEFADGPNQKRSVHVDPSVGLQRFKHV